MIQIVGQKDKYIHILGFLINLSDRQEARGGYSSLKATPFACTKLGRVWWKCILGWALMNLFTI